MSDTDRLKMLPVFRRRFDRVGRALGFEAGDVGEWRRWRGRLRRRLREITGVEAMAAATQARRTPLRPRVTERVELPDYVRERLEITTEPGVVMTLFVLTPKNAQPPYPAVIAPHGHASGGKSAIVGDRTNPQVAEMIDKANYNYGEQFARAGFLTFCPDARGFGERAEAGQWGASAFGGSCHVLSHMGQPLGLTVTGMWTWDLMRLIDYIQTRGDCAWVGGGASEVERKEGKTQPGAAVLHEEGRTRREAAVPHKAIGCAGLSGGGLQTLWLAALDDRVRCAVVSGYFYGYKNSLLDAPYHCSCNFVPRLFETADMGDLGALIAPRPLLIETGNRDGLNGSMGLRNVRSQVRIARRAYSLRDARAAFYHHVFDGEHRWCGEKAIPWMRRWLMS